MLIKFLIYKYELSSLLLPGFLVGFGKVVAGKTDSLVEMLEAGSSVVQVVGSSVVQVVGSSVVQVVGNLVVQ